MQIVDDVPPANLPDSQGSRSDLGFSFNSRVPAAAHWDMGIAFGAFAGYWPMAPTGTMIGCWPHARMRPATAGDCGTTAFGIDFAGLGGGGAVTFTGAAFASAGFKVDGAGNTSVAELTTSSGIKSAGAVFAAPTLTACRGTGTPIGGAVAGSVTITTGGSSCTVKFHELPPAPHGWICTVFDQTQAALLPQSANDTTSCTVRGNIASGDTLVFHAAVSY